MTNMDISVRNMDKLQTELAELLRRFPTAVQRTSNFVAQSTAQRAKNKVRKGTRTGKLFELSNGAFHQASAPGEPPANLTGQLADSIKFTKMTSSPTSTADAGSGLRKARILELGGIARTDARFGSRDVRIEPRPFLLPSFLEAIQAAETKLKDEVER